MSDLKTNFKYTNKNISLKVGKGIVVTKSIKKGEKIIESENLANELDMINNLPNFTIIAMPIRKIHNVQLTDKNTLVAIRDISVGESIIPYYSKQTKRLITAPNMFLYYLGQFFTVLLLIAIVIIGISLFA